jgi:hypothetical protein
VQTPGTLPLAYRLLYRCAVRTALGEKPKARLDRAEIPSRKGFLVDHPFFYIKALFGSRIIQFNSHHINIPSNAWSTKCTPIACMSAQIMSNLRDESIKPN